uniref:Histone deacetylase interacting domain-containing protein n=1 Tax=Spongospora subterranea TaxID=70186 RepID=A0A0H5QK25_9EUKA|eukprot:CRZ01972.1 hypothetical protein [Spongospora subterranea]
MDREGPPSDTPAPIPPNLQPTPARRLFGNMQPNMQYTAMMAARSRVAAGPRPPLFDASNRPSGLLPGYPPGRGLPMIPPPLRRRGNGAPLPNRSHLFQGHVPQGRGTLLNRPGGMPQLFQDKLNQHQNRSSPASLLPHPGVSNPPPTIMSQPNPVSLPQSQSQMSHQQPPQALPSSQIQQSQGPSMSRVGPTVSSSTTLSSPSIPLPVAKLPATAPVSTSSGSLTPQAVLPADTTPGPTLEMPKVKDALGYLEKVKKKFFDRPNVYNQFLEIMKEFKAQTINTEGVIKRVTTLFQGHRELILGFNQFLPPGYKITDPTAPPSEPAPKPTVEFNHAVKYVAKIKQRFESRPEVYEDFLEILHAYQEKRATDHAIEQVKGQVQNLFRGHPDLLDDFNYFLPPEAGGAMFPGGIAGKQPKKKKQKKDEPGPPVSIVQPTSRRSEPSIAVPPRMGLPLGPSTSPTVGPAAVRRMSGNVGALIPPGPYATVSYPPDSKKEMQLFEKIKLAVPRSLYLQLMRVLNLFSCNIVTRAELMSLVDDLFLRHSKYAEFATKFKEVLGYDEWEENQLMTHMRSNFYAFVSSVDFTTCKQVTPSYRELPAEIPCPPCSGRTILGDTVLNDTCISIPTGTEDQSFKSSRKNQYEEALFKVEDERYEIDMMIENNAAAIRVLQPLHDRVETMTAEQAAAFKLDDSVDILHIRAMARIYGDAWYDIVRLLKQIPATAISVILRRLKQKDAEWRRARENMKRPWQDIVKANFHRSLDHRSFTFKSEEKKRLSSKCLIFELKDAHEKSFEQAEEKATGFSVLSTPQQSRPLYTYCMSFTFDDASVHTELYNLLSTCTEYIAVDDRKPLLSFWTEFVQQFFNTVPEREVVSNSEVSTRPVRMSMDAWTLEEMINPMRRHTRESHLFFGSMQFYVFFRLYQMLYSRWKTSRDLALSKPNGEAVYSQFKDLVFAIIDGHTDQTAYEDSLRTLVGAKSYSMFTVDKLVAALIKLTQSLTVNPVNQRLIGLYNYEHSRAIDKEQNSRGQDPLERSALMARMYLMNCASIIEDDDHCVQIEYFKDTCELGIGYLENFGSSDSKYSNPSCDQFLDRYLNSSSNCSPPFLRRNLSKRIVNDDIVTRNGLESKICRRTLKAYFIEGTEDIFYRRQRSKITRPDKRQHRFESWRLSQPAIAERSGDSPIMFQDQSQTSQVVPSDNQPISQPDLVQHVASPAQPMDLS